MSPIAWPLYIIFIYFTALTIHWSLRQPDGVYQFPLLSGCVWLAYIGIQALGVLISPDLLPSGAISDYGIEKALIVATFCVASGYFGYVSKRINCERCRTVYSLSPSRLWGGGMALAAVAWISFFKLASLSGGVLLYFSITGRYQLTLLGLPVAYIFFTKLIYPATAICLTATLNRPSKAKWFFVVFCTLLPLANIFLLGRRTEAVTLTLTYSLVFYFQRGWIPKRTVVIYAMVLGGIMLIVAPAYRTHSQIGGDFNKIFDLDITNMLREEISGKNVSEFHYPVVQLAATDRAMEFNFGVGFINRIIQDWVPSLLFTREFKNELFLDAVDFRAHTLDLYGWLPNYGWIPTAIVDVFREFWYFGALLFYFIGRGMNYLWLNAIVSGSEESKIFYTSIAPLAMITVISGVTAFVSLILYYVLFIYPIFFFARERKIVRSL